MSPLLEGSLSRLGEGNLRIAIFSDVHANVHALRAVLAHIQEQGVDAMACLGDVVGYGGAPQETCTLVRQAARWTVLGNHDAAVAERMNYDYYYSSARDALDLHRSQLDEENLLWLKHLPWQYREPGLLLTHGRPDAPEAFEYMFNNNHALALLAVYDTLEQVNFIGHSHLTHAYRLKPGADEETKDVSSALITIEDDAKYVITVGSVGQPRDNDPRSCYVIYDREMKTVEFFRVPYDVRGAAMKIWSEERLSPEFAKRLYLGV